MKLWRRTTILTLGFIESLIFSGCLFGWPSLLHVLQEEGVYSHLCVNNNTEEIIDALLPGYASPEIGFTYVPNPKTRLERDLSFSELEDDWDWGSDEEGENDNISHLGPNTTLTENLESIADPNPSEIISMLAPELQATSKPKQVETDRKRLENEIPINDDKNTTGLLGSSMTSAPDIYEDSSEEEIDTGTTSDLFLKPEKLKTPQLTDLPYAIIKSRPTTAAPEAYLNSAEDEISTTGVPPDSILPDKPLPENPKTAQKVNPTSEQFKEATTLLETFPTSNDIYITATLPSTVKVTPGRLPAPVSDLIDDDVAVTEAPASTSSTLGPRPVSTTEKSPTKRRKCSAQTVEMTKIYTIAAVSYGVTSVLVGFALDVCGLWFTRIGGSLMTTGGFICLAYTSKETSWLLWPALNLIALGSSQLRLSTFQFANLWPNHRTTILIGYSSAYSISTTLFLFIQFAYYASIPFRVIGYILSGLAVLTFPPTILMPRMKIDDHIDFTRMEKGRKVSFVNTKTDEVIRMTEPNSDNKPRFMQSKGNKDAKDPRDIFDGEEKHDLNRVPVIISQSVPLGTSLWTLSSLLHVFWHFINFFLVLFYSSTFIMWIEKMTSDPNVVAHYNSVSGLCAVIAPIFIPIAGLVTDWQIRRAGRLDDRIEKVALTIQAPAFTMAIASLFIVGTMICKLFFTKAAVYLSLVLIAVGRPFIVGSCTSYIRIRFHPSHFNRLNGIFTTIVSLFTLLHIPILKWMERSDRDFIAAQIFLIVLLLLSLSSPGHLMIKPLARKYARTQLHF